MFLWKLEIYVEITHMHTHTHTENLYPKAMDPVGKK